MSLALLYVYRYGYLKTINQTGIEQVIQWAVLYPWILIYHYGDHLFFFYEYGLYM